MKLYLKMTAVLLAFIMSFGFGVFAQGETLVEVSENENTQSFEKYDNAINTLIRLGILNAETFDPAASVKRGDFIKAAMAITGIETVNKDTVFSDVKADDINSGAIAAAYDMGIIKGYGNGTLGKDDLLQSEQSAKILVSILGYDVLAESYGGYPAGYLSVATMQGLLKGVEVGEFKECNWAVAAQLIYNALHCDLLQSKTYPEEKYTTVEGENPMTKWLGIYYCEGVVAANDYTAVVGNVKSYEGSIKLSNIKKSSTLPAEESFKENGTGLSDKIGYPIKLYYKFDESDTPTCISYQLKNGVKEEYIHCRLISDKSNNKTIYADKDNKQIMYNLAATPIVFYNGMVTSKPLTADLLIPSYGGVYVIDADGNNTYDIVKIEDKSIYFVKELTNLGLVKDAYGAKTFKVPVDDSDVTLKIYKDGKEGVFGDLSERQVLSVMESEDKSLMTIEISTVNTKGVLEEVGENYAKISGEEFEVADNVKGEIANMPLNEKTMFYFTSDFYLAGYQDKNGGASSYAYATIGTIKKTGLTEKATIRFMDLSAGGIVKTMEVDEDVFLNGERIGDDGEVTPKKIFKLMEKHSLGEQTGKNQTYFINGLFKYESADGEKITSIDLPIDNTVENGGTALYVPEFSHDWKYRNNSTRAHYTSFDLLDGKYMVENSMALRIPGQDIWNGFYAGDYSVEQVEAMMQMFEARPTWESNNDVKNADVYDCDENWNAGVIIEHKTQAVSYTPKDELFLVEKMVTGLDNDGIEKKYIYGCYKDECKAFGIDTETLPESVYKTLQPGDILRVAQNALGEITAIYKLFTMKKENKGDWKNGGYLMCGEEYDMWGHKDENFAKWENHVHEDGAYEYVSNWCRSYQVFHSRLSKYLGNLGGRYFVDFGYREGQEDNPVSEKLVCNYKNQFIYVYDEATGKTRRGSNADLNIEDPRQTVFIRARYFGAFEIVIINRAKDPGTLYWVGGFN